MLQRPQGLLLAALIALLAILAIVPILPGEMAGPYAIKFITRVIIMAIFIVSLDLLIGITGLVSFGHATFFGLGAYAVWFVTPKFDPGNLALAIGLAVALAAAAAALIGSLVVRTRGFYFIMATLAFGEMMFALFHDTKFAGGSDGVTLNFKPLLKIGGTTILDFSGRFTLYYFALVSLVIAYVICMIIARSRFGRVLQTIRWNETRAQALGFNTYAYKLAIYIIAGAMAGFSGALFASIDGFVPPQLLGWRESGIAIMMVVLGGVGTLHGALFGTFIYNFVEEILRDRHIVGQLASDHWPISMGLFLIAIVLAAPNGVAGWFKRRKSEAPSPAAAPVQAARALHAIAPPVVQTRNLSRHFGGLVAVDAVSLRFEPNRIHAIIGPNGAGKTTFTNVLSGLLPPSEGTILLGEQDITALPVHRKARLGLGRSFQRTNIVPAFTVEENCLIAAQAQTPDLFARKFNTNAEANSIEFALNATGLTAVRHRPVAELSHGEQRQIEIAMLIASGSRILVLDEPLAGTGPEETRRVTELLRDLARDHTIILIEHDMDAVFSVADEISVLVNGRLIATGSPDQIRNNEQVREAYLGSFEPEGSKA